MKHFFLKHHEPKKLKLKNRINKIYKVIYNFQQFM